MTPTFDFATLQQALDALVTGDHHAATRRFSEDVVVTGVGGCLSGRILGLTPVLDRFAEMSRLTHGTFGTEVSAVYRGAQGRTVVVARHWALLDGAELRATQALVMDTESERIRAIDILSGPGPRSGVWD